MRGPNIGSRISALYPCSVKGVRRGNWQGTLVAEAAKGLGRSHITTIRPQTESRAAPAPGIRHLHGAGHGLGTGGHQGWREMMTISPTIYHSVSSLTQSSESFIGATLCQYPRAAPWAVCEVQSPQEMLSHGMVPPPVVPLRCLRKHCSCPTTCDNCLKMTLSAWKR